MKRKQTAEVISQTEIAPGIYDMWIATDLAAEAKAGQFICVYPKDKSTLLPRPISICEVDAAGQALRIVYRVAGAGTAEFSTYKAKDTIDIMGTLGNGFPVKEGVGKRAVLMGGGIGVPPILELAKRMKMAGAEVNSTAGDMGSDAKVQVVVGYRDGHLFLKEDLEKYGEVYVACEDGSAGVKGNVLDAMAQEGLEADVIFACGPMPMLRAIKKYAAEKGIKAYISLEERMACGVGACLGCVVKTKEIDHHSHVHNARICTDGPVYDAEEVEI